MPHPMLSLIGLLFAVSVSSVGEIPKVVTSAHGSQLIVDGKPFLIFGGELGNSSAGTAAQADTILPRVARLHVNTVLMPVAWEQIEPSEGNFDFSILDHWIDVARTQHLRLGVLWFGSWKNAFSNYAPAWVKQDTRRFPRAISADGSSTEILSTLGPETLQADTRAFARLMVHLREKDVDQQTVLLVQVENEVGFLGRGRDRSAAANALFAQPVPEALLKQLEQRKATLSPELASHFTPGGGTWKGVFGDAADEVFMAWHYATFIQHVIEAGKRAYSLPMYVNCQLPAPTERAGEYPSGAPHPYYLDVYRIAAPAIDFYSPDIYWPDFEYWIERYHQPGNAVFVPEARIEAAPINAFYAYGQANAFGFSAFGIDSIETPADPALPRPAIAQTYGALTDLQDLLISAQASGTVRALTLHANSPRPVRTVALGGYLFEATLSRSWPARSLLTDDGAMTIIQASPDEFYIAGRGLTVNFYRDPDTDDRIAGIARIEEVSREAGAWVTQRRLNGDQSNQGRQLSMDANQVRIYRVVLYTMEREPHGSR